MVFRFREVIVVGFVANLVAALALVPLGFFLFTKAFPLLYWNEGRTGMAEQAQQAPVADADAPGEYEGRFVNVEGPLRSDTPAMDVRFLDEGPWVAVVRVVETFAWVEKSSTTRTRQLGGSTKVETEWTHDTDWVARVTPPDEMKYPEGHENPAPRFRTELHAGERPSIGRTPFVLESALGLPWEPLALDDPDVRIIGEGREGQVYGDALYYGVSNPGEPGVGDQLVRFYVLPRDAQVSAFGSLSGGLLQEHQWKDALPLLVALPGSRDDAISLLRGNDRLVTWVFRLSGVLAIWGGLMLMLSPLFALFDILPPLGTVVRVVVGVALAAPALALALIPIGISQLAHSTPALVIIAASLLYVLWARWRMRRDGLLV